MSVSVLRDTALVELAVQGLEQRVLSKF